MAVRDPITPEGTGLGASPTFLPPSPPPPPPPPHPCAGAFATVSPPAAFYFLCLFPLPFTSLTTSFLLLFISPLSSSVRAPPCGPNFSLLLICLFFFPPPLTYCVFAHISFVTCHFSHLSWSSPSHLLSFYSSVLRCGFPTSVRVFSSFSSPFSSYFLP